MKKRNKKLFIIFFSLMFMTSFLFISFSEPVWAEGNEEDLTPERMVALYNAAIADGDDEGTGVHADPETFKKNFRLSVAQKEYTIT